ncbi:MAG: hypothetical protein K2G44_03940 [Clostridia bacterium]|nr:hypothetical protein [Clostridia bacterium]
MKKKLIAIILAICCLVFCLSACDLGSYVNNGNDSSNTTNPNNPDKPVDPDNPDNPDDPEKPDTSSHYTLKVYYNNHPFNPGSSQITAVWSGDSIKRVELDENGTADAGELDGSFGVYLEGLPDKYTYNPNEYETSETARNVVILLIDVKQPVRGDGKGLYASQGCYSVRYDGTYRTQIDKEGDVRYYDYTPMEPGWYSVTSWASVYADEINPFINIYAGSAFFKILDKTVDNGGVELPGGYTKNFRYECRFDASEVGNSFCFAVGASSKSNQYPVYVDFEIKYEGEYTSPSSDVREVRAEEAKYPAPPIKAGETFSFIDFGTKVFDSSYVRYNEDTKRYHYYSMELFGDNYMDGEGYNGAGKGYGPYLLCAISKSIPSYTTTTLYNANAVGDVKTNYLWLYNMPIEEDGREKLVTLDYTKFIREDYYAKCNSDGVCYVTKELKDFLQSFAEKRYLFSDGLTAEEGTPEDSGYLTRNNGSWLFACGIYIPVGQSPSDFI